MSGRNSVSRCARFESLEQRQLLAGDVMVGVVGGNLMIQGDELDNQIAVTAGTEPGTYVVKGLDGTNVVLTDGQNPEPAQSEVVVTGVYRGARISMGDGNDLVVLNQVHFRDEVGIGTGAGNDRVLVGVPLSAPESAAAELADTASAPAPGNPPPLVTVGGALRIMTRGGEDFVHVGDAAILGRLGIATGSENDRVVLGAEPVETPDEPATEVSQAPTETPPRPALHVGRGIDVQLGDGDDMLTTGRVGTPGGFLVNGGGGGDHVRLHATRVGHLLAVDAGADDGADRVSLDRVHAGVALVATGRGQDDVRIADSVFHMLGIDLGDGEDSLSLRGNRARLAVLLGGEGQDTLIGLAENQFGHKIVRSFELPPPAAGAGTGETAANPAVA